MKRKYRIYVAIPWDPITKTKFREHSRKGFQRSKDISELGFAVYVPFLDYYFVNWYGSNADYLSNALEWLKVSDAVFVDLEDRVDASVAKELQTAMEHGIRIFTSLEDLKEGFEKND